MCLVGSQGPYGKTDMRQMSLRQSSSALKIIRSASASHHLEISYYVNFLGRLCSNGFHLK